ncbi:MAG: BrnT family toxin [Anaerolineales bacterium]|nr:BrnT family toxin [Anaerolineales bacterium]
MQRLIIEDTAHSFNEQRYFCLGKVDDEVLTVRFTYRNGIIRIIGAGYWRKGKKRYEEENQLQ